MKWKNQLCVVGLFWLSSAYAEVSLVNLVEEQGTNGRTNSEIIDTIQKEVRKRTDQNGRVTPELQKELYALEEKYSGRFDAQTLGQFQTLIGEIGAKMKGPMQMPQEQTPFWLLEKGELYGFRSSPTLPKKAHVVIIGAGLTGTSAAYHLTEAAHAGKKVIVLEAGQIASQSSGRNGGNFQLLSESYTGSYEGLVQERLKWLELSRSDLTVDEKKALAEKEAEALLKFSLHNFQRFRSIVAREKIQCDFNEEGWLRIAGSREEEAALLKDMEWLNAHKTTGTPDMALWSAKEIADRTGVRGPYLGRFIAKNGNYHPYKFVTAGLKTAIQKGVQLYTGVQVQSVTPQPQDDRILVKTSEGDILAEKVIVATNSQTPKLFPQLKAIETVPSQIYNLEHAENRLQGATLTERGGDLYYNFPRSKTYTDSQGKLRGMVHFGLDFSGPVQDFSGYPRSEPLFKEMKVMTDQRFPDTQDQPPSRMWTGPMAFTEDHIPVIGFMESKNIIIAAAFQGYGGSFCTQAGYVAAEMALTGKVHPDVPESMFSPLRFKKRPAARP